MLARGLQSLAAVDPGWHRLRLALRAVLAAALSGGLVLALGLPPLNLMLGAMSALMPSMMLRSGTALERLVNVALMVPAMFATATIAAFASANWLLEAGSLVAIVFVAAYARRFDLGLSLGMVAFVAFVISAATRQQPDSLPLAYLAIGIGLAVTALLAVVVFPESPRRTLRRTVPALLAQVGRVADEVGDIVERGRPISEAEGRPAALTRRLAQLHETTMTLETAAEAAELDARWPRELLNVELAADRLARSVTRALSRPLPPDVRHEVAADMRRLRWFVGRDPGPAHELDIDVLARHIAKHDLAAPQEESERELRVRLLYRAVRELLLAVVRMRQRLRYPDRRTSGDSAAGEEAESPEIRELARQSELDDDPDASDDSDDSGESEERVNGDGRRLLPTTRTAIQATLAAGLAVLGGELISPQRWYWAVIAAFVIFTGATSRGQVLVRAWARFLGTALGCIAGMVLGSLLDHHTGAVLVCLLLSAFIAFYFLASQVLMNFFLALMIGMLFDFLGVFSNGLLGVRLLETAVGALAGGIAAMLVLPSRTSAEVDRALHDFFEALSGHLCGVRDLVTAPPDARSPTVTTLDLLATTREVDRAAAEVDQALLPKTYPIGSSRARRDITRRLRHLVAEAADAARMITHATEPGVLADLPAAGRTQQRLLHNLHTLAARTADPREEDDELVSGPVLGPAVNVAINATDGTAPARLESLSNESLVRLRRTVHGLDRLDEVLLGMAKPLHLTVTVPGERGDGSEG